MKIIKNLTYFKGHSFSTFISKNHYSFSSKVIMKTHEILIYLNKATPEINLNDYDLKIEDSPNSGEGFIGLIIFVILKHKCDQNKNLNLVLKCSKPSKALRENTPLVELFLNEIAFYTEVYPKLNSLEEKLGAENGFKAIPKYYGHYMDETDEILVLENMVHQGYKMLSPEITLPMDHTKLVIEHLAKWHGMSFVFKNRYPEEFKNLTQQKNLYYDFVYASGGYENLRREYEGSGIFLPKTQNLEEFIKFDDFDYLMKDAIFSEDSEYSVISHGDCWNNNLLFKYDDHSQRNQVTSVIILDWQFTILSSPIIDLCMFLYTTSSKIQFDHLTSMLDHYHDTLARFLADRGCSVERLYPYRIFRKQWERMHKYGYCLTPDLIKHIWGDPVLAGVGDEDMELFSAPVIVRDEKAYRSRMQDVVNGFYEVERGKVQ